jgi:toluene monooxygenase system ferredoxin subunit
LDVRVCNNRHPIQRLSESFLLVRNLRVAGQTFILRRRVLMAFTSICKTSAMSEGGMGLFHAGKKSVLLVWPTGGKLKAYRGRCPHADMPLDNVTYDGKTITCMHHQWGFDCASGECVTHLVRNALHQYPCAWRVTRSRSTSARSRRRVHRRAP